MLPLTAAHTPTMPQREELQLTLPTFMHSSAVLDTLPSPLKWRSSMPL